jgi:hypothetical protein
MNRSSNDKRRRCHFSAHFLVLALAATLLLSMVPLGKSVSASDNQIFQATSTEVVDPGVVDDTVAEKPVDDPTVDDPVIETPTPEPTLPVIDLPVATVVAVDPGNEGNGSNGSITINKHVCDGPVDGDIYNMAAACQGADIGFAFNLYFGDGAPIQSGTTSNYLVSFGGLTTGLGDYDVAEVPSAGYDNAIVWCSVKDYLGNTTQPLFPAYLSNNWSTEIHLQNDGDMAFCDWFNYNNTPAQTTGSVMINKSVCPLGFDAYNADIYGIAANCHEVPGPTSFTLTDANGGQQTGTTPGSAPYLVQWDNVPSGMETIVEQIPTGFGTPRVFCKNSKYTGEEDAEAEVQVNGGTVGVQLKAGYDFLYCDWINIPTPEMDGKVEIHKWDCPADFVPSSGDQNEYLTYCTQTMNGVVFHAASNGSDLPTKTTGDDGDGTVIWTPVDEGSLVIQEEIPAGYDYPIVFCGFSATYSNDAGAPAIIDGKIYPTDVVAGVLQHDMLKGETLYCDWFNIPTHDNYDGSITIYKHTCPAGYDVNAYGANPWLDCPELTNGITFTLYHGADVPLQTNTGDSIDGAVYWGGLYGGDYQVQEAMPADTSYAFVYGCMSDAVDTVAPTDLIGLQGDNSFLVTLKANEHLTCHWYNVPNQHGGTIVITKYWCDTNVYTTYACDIYEGGASFTVTDESNSGFQVTTGVDGTVTFSVASGTYDLDEVGGSWCRAESTQIDQNGRIVVQDNTTTYVTIFNCGQREIPKTPKGPKFPNTGVNPELAQNAI